MKNVPGLQPVAGIRAAESQDPKGRASVPFMVNPIVWVSWVKNDMVNYL